MSPIERPASIAAGYKSKSKSHPQAPSAMNGPVKVLSSRYHSCFQRCDRTFLPRESHASRFRPQMRRACFLSRDVQFEVRVFVKVFRPVRFGMLSGDLNGECHS